MLVKNDYSDFEVVIAISSCRPPDRMREATIAALVGYRLIPVQDDRLVYPNSVWADPDIGQAAEWGFLSGLLYITIMGPTSPSILSKYDLIG